MLNRPGRFLPLYSSPLPWPAQRPIQPATGSCNMAALHNLPVEVLFQICSALCHKRVETGGRIEISHRLPRTCRRLRDIAQLLIFTAVDLSEFTRARQIKLIRTLSTRPDLAQHLKVLVINPTSNEPDLSPADIAYVSQYYILGDRFDVPFSEFLSIYAAALNLQEL